MKTIKQWVLETYSNDHDNNEIKDIAEHGCASGCAIGLIYYYETVKFHDEFEQQIWDMLYEDAQDQCITTIELIAQFNGQNNVCSMDSFKNLLAWYAVERVCHEIINEQEDN